MRTFRFARESMVVGNGYAVKEPTLVLKFQSSASQHVAMSSLMQRSSLSADRRHQILNRCFGINSNKLRPRRWRNWRGRCLQPWSSWRISSLMANGWEVFRWCKSHASAYVTLAGYLKHILLRVRYCNLLFTICGG